MRKHLKHNLLYLFIFIITILGCGSDMNTSSNDTGSLSFALKWETPSNNPLTKTSDISSPLAGEGKGEGGFNTQNSELSYAPIDCTVLGVSTVSANVYDSGGTYITSGGPWNCADHSGTITGISAGINRMITINGKDSSSRIIYNGQITGVTIDKDQTTNAGQITMTYVANDTTAPTDGTLSASAGNSQVSLSWSGFSDSGSGLGSYKLVYSTTTTPSSCSSGTQIFTGTGTSYTHTGLINSTTYYYRICATDNAGNTSNGATASGIPQSTGTTTTTTTTGGETTTSGSAPSAPTGVSASAGNGQTTVSWSSVSGAIAYNIYWSTTSGVTKTSGTQITNVTSPYTHTGRTNGTTYYYVVTAVNSSGESSESSLVSATPTLTVTDIDGNVYNTVTIGTQVWMKENLKVTKYRNGDAIGTTTPATLNISGETSPKYQWAYDGNESNVATYGRLYTWHAATDSRGVCPTGWHVPSDAEWTTLINYLGGESVAGGKMKEAGTTHWYGSNTGADNSSGFTALPGGYRIGNGTFISIGGYSYWWSATEYGATDAWDRYLYFNSGNAYRTASTKTYGFGVRCVRD